MTKKVWNLLTGIILIAAIFRLWGLGNVPPSPDWDEVALGYNAYSIIHTGRDEFGKFFPVVLRSFDDYKPAMYSYLCIPSIEVFGLTVYAIRFPSAIFGLLTILAVFFLMKEIFKRNDIALLVSFLLAISPWHIQFSRLGFETNVGLAFNIFAALFFIKGLKRPWLLIPAALSAVCAIYTYQSEKVFSPLFIALLILVYYRKVWKVPKKYIIAGLAVGVVTILPMALFILNNKQALLRVKGTVIFNSPTTYLSDNPQRIIDDRANHDYLGLFLDNRRFIFGRAIIGGYLSHYNVNWLLNGDISRHHAPDMGLIYVLEIPFILIGIYQLLFGPYDKKTKALIFGWFLLAPVPASVTTGVPHAVRTMNFLPTWQVFSALGLLTTYYSISKFRLGFVKQVAFLGFSVIAVLNFIYYLDQYFVQQNYFHAKEWQYGYAQLIPTIDQMKGSYKKIVVSETEPMDKSYMFFLFYLKYSPENYQYIGEHSSGGFAADHHFDKYSFRPINWDKDSKERNVLFIGPPGEFPQGRNEKYIYYPDGTPAIEITKT